MERKGGGTAKGDTGGAVQEVGGESLTHAVMKAQGGEMLKRMVWSRVLKQQKDKG